MKIIFPLDERVYIRGCAEHKAAGLGCGTDYKAVNVPLYSPVDGVIKRQYFGNDGGNWIWIEDAEGRMWEFAHLSEYKLVPGVRVIAGQQVAVTGNTGNITTGPHCHVQLIAAGHNGSPTAPRIDPHSLLANVPLPMSFDTSHIGKEGTLVRIGVSPLRYGYILRGKRFEFSMANNDVLMLIYSLEKNNIIPKINMSSADWETIPKSNGVKF